MKGFNSAAWPTTILLLLIFSGCALEQRKFWADQEGYRRASASGQLKEFLTDMETQASEAEKRHAWQEAFEPYRWAAIAANSSRQLQRALTYANKALEIAEKARSPELQVGAVLVLVGVHRALGQRANAREWIEKGIGITRQLPLGTFKDSYVAAFYRYLGIDSLRDGEFQKAVEHLSYSLQVGEGRLAHLERSRPLRNPAWIGNAQESVLSSLISLGTAYRSAGNLEASISTFEKGINIIKGFGLTTGREARLYQELGQTYLARKEFIRAHENLQRSLELAEGRDQVGQIQLANASIGNLLLEMQKPSEAIPYLQRAIDYIESTRSLLQSEEHRQSYFEGERDAYVRIMNALLLAGKQEEAFNYGERARSRVFLDVLGSKVQLSRVKSGLLEEERALQERIAAIKARLSGAEEGETDRSGLRKQLAEAEKAYGAFLAKVRKQDKEQASLMSVEPLTLKEVQELLDPGTTLVEYFVANTNIHVWVVEKERSQYLNVSLARGDLSKQVKALRESIFNLEEKSKFTEVSTALYQQLIQPVLPHVSGKELIIVPHDVLHYLPFHALISPKGKYLIEDYPIYYLSSASLLQFTREKRKAKGDLSAVLALGNPDLGDPQMNLQFAELEAKEIQGLYPQSTVFVRKEATEEKSKALSPQYDILHFAAHAELKEDDPLSSAVLLARDGKEDGRLEVREIFGMDLKANLVVLSACETGLGKLSGGDELVGLTRAFIYAGTPSVVASLWKVEDSSTAQLMTSFYRNLRTMSKVEALRQAQLELIRGQASSDLLARRGVGGIGKLGELPEAKPQSSTSVPDSVSTSHPYFWAPFILVGDGK